MTLSEPSSVNSTFAPPLAPSRAIQPLGFSAVLRFAALAPLLPSLACSSPSSSERPSPTGELDASAPSSAELTEAGPVPTLDADAATDENTAAPPEDSDSGSPAESGPGSSSSSAPSSTTSAESPSNPTTGEEPALAKAHFFLPTPEVDNTGAPHLQVDKDGGLHAAYPTYVGKGAYYAYCDKDCDEESDVKVVRFETELSVSNALVGITADGKPRVLLSAWDQIYYAQCDEDCTKKTSWDIGSILKHDNVLEITGEAFALDSNAKPHFLLHTYVVPFGVSALTPETYVASCTDACTLNANWTAAKVADEIWEGGTLRFGMDDDAHIFAAAVQFDAGVPKARVPVYAECSDDCVESPEQWHALSLGYPAYEDREKAVSIRPSLSMELTKDGAPRVLAMLEGEAEDERMIAYMACEDGCVEDGAAWSGTVVSNHPDLAAGLDLALDAHDNPRLVYNIGYSIFLAACDTGVCSDAPSEWAISPVEAAADMPPDEIILWPNCNVDAWFLHSPNLVLTQDGNPRVGYQATDLSGGGVPMPDPGQSPCLAGIDLTWTRLTAFTRR